jgi:hypothetical protein
MAKRGPQALRAQSQQRCGESVLCSAAPRRVRGGVPRRSAPSRSLSAPARPEALGIEDFGREHPPSTRPAREKRRSSTTVVAFLALKWALSLQVWNSCGRHRSAVGGAAPAPGRVAASRSRANQRGAPSFARRGLHLLQGARAQAGAVRRRVSSPTAFGNKRSNDGMLPLHVAAQRIGGR